MIDAELRSQHQVPLQIATLWISRPASRTKTGPGYLVLLSEGGSEEEKEHCKGILLERTLENLHIEDLLFGFGQSFLWQTETTFSSLRERVLQKLVSEALLDRI